MEAHKFCIILRVPILELEDTQTQLKDETYN